MQPDFFTIVAESRTVEPPVRLPPPLPSSPPPPNMRLDLYKIASCTQTRPRVSDEMNPCQEAVMTSRE